LNQVVGFNYHLIFMKSTNIYYTMFHGDSKELHGEIF